MAGVLKVVLALQNRAVPPSLHFDTPNPDIPFDELNLRVVTEYTPLAAGGRPAVMGVNSFGFGGANAHVVLREAAAPERQAGAGPEHGVVPLFLSARSGEALKATAERHLALLSAAGAPEPYDVAWTAATRRQRHPHRLAVFGAGRDELTRRLGAFVAGDGGDGVVSGRVVGRPARLALLFSGNGAQWPGMGRRLLASDPVFRAEVERVDELLRPLAGFSVIEELEAPPERNRLHLTGVAQPLLFALQLGLVEALLARGLVFDAVLGHSVGEVAAARAAGAFDLEQAVRLIHQRSAVQELTRGFGRMAAAALAPEAAEAELAAFDGEIELAAVNSPESVTLSGPLAALEELGRRLAARGVFYRVLDLDYAFHSRVMDPVREPLLEALAGLEPGDLAVPFVSSVTGGRVEGGQLGAEYWWRNVRSPVRLDRAMAVLVEEGFDVFLEVGPHPIMQKYVNENLRAAGSSGRSAYTLHRDSDDSARLWQVIGSVEVLGCGLDTGRLFPERGRRVDLPGYPWQRERHWHGSSDESFGLLGVPQDHPLLGHRLAQTEGVWSNALDLARVPYLADHVVGGSAIFPAAAFVEMALAAAEARSPGTSHELESLEIRAPMTLAGGSAQSVRFTLDDDGEFTIESRPRLGDPEWTVHAAGRLASPSFRTPPPAAGAGAAMAAPAGARRIGGDEHRRQARAIGLAYGPAFSGLREVLSTGETAVARLELPPEVAGDAGRYRFHPCLLDAGLQVMVGLCADQADSRRPACFLPFSIGRLISHRPAGTAAVCRVEIEKRSKRSVVASFRFLDSEGGTVAEIEGFRFRRARWVQEAGGDAGHYHYRPVLASRRGRAAAAAPAPAELAGRVAPRLAEVAREHRRDDFYGQVLPLFDALVAGFALRAVHGLRAGRERFTADDLVAGGAVDPSQRALLEWLLAILAEDGLAEAGPAEDGPAEDGPSEDGAVGWTLADPAGQPEPEEIWRLILADYPAYAEEATLAGRTGLHLPEILRDGGGLPGVPAGGAGAARLCDASPTWRLAAAAVGETLAAVAGAWPAGRRLRILEIGCGGTDLAADLLASLPMDRCDYVFAAADERARSRAAAELADYAGHRVIQLGIDGDPAGQGLAAGDFDVVIANHALHSAGQPDLALAGLRRLLAEGGLLLALERSPERHTDLVLGVDSGWWRPADENPRPRPRTRPAEAWKRAAERQGFAEAVAVAEPAPGAAASAYLLLARNPEAAAGAAEPAAPRAVLVLCDAEGEPAAVAGELTGRLEAAGHRVVRAVAGAAFARAGAGEFTVAPKQPWELARLIETLRREGVEIAEVVHLMGLELGPGSDLMELQDRRCTSTLHLVQALAAAEGAAPPRLWLVTAGAAALSPSSRAPGIGRPIPSQAPLWGLGRVLMNEHPELRCRLVDLYLDDRADGAEGRAALAAELVAVELAYPDDEDEILLTAGARYGMRLERLAADAAPPAAGGIGDSERVRLDFADPGPLGNLGWHVEPRRPPGAGEIEVRVRATGLNFRDVMFAMGLLTDEAVENGFAGATLGMECAGDVVAVGAGVEGLAAGDRVMCFAPACFASHVTTGTTAVARMPEGWSYEEGATVPGAFLTVYYALDHLAQLQAGERVLIHGAAGGVGLAAIQFARYKGAEIFATAGSEEKRDFLRLLGVEHVLDSRTLAFADEILERTGGEGVDVVLNSLSGEAVAKNLAVLKPFGRFLELGKRDFYENTKIGLRPFRNNISYFGIDADQLMVERPELAGRLYREVEGLLARGTFRPLPHRVFPAGRAADAFRYMQQSRQIGKVIVTNRVPVAATRGAAAAPAGLRLEPEATYLVTGGLGGFGLATAHWLAARGARSLVLVGRSGAARPEAQEAVAELEAAGVRVTVARADVAKLDELRGVLDEIAAELPPLRGVVHGAMVLEDGLIRNLDRRRLLRVLAPKVLGARNLDQLTRGLPLDFFVLYSSATTCFGNPGQGNYVAANLYLEALAEERRAAGRPALASAGDRSPTSASWPTTPRSATRSWPGSAAGRSPPRRRSPTSSACSRRTGAGSRSPRSTGASSTRGCRAWPRRGSAASAAAASAATAPATRTSGS